MYKFRIACFFILGIVLWGLLFPVVSDGYVFQDENRGTDLSIFGLGMIRLNHASVDGDVLAFENSDDGYTEGFDTRGFLSLTTSGILFHDYGLEGFARYDKDDDPDWNFLFTLSRDKNANEFFIS